MLAEAKADELGLFREALLLEGPHHLLGLIHLLAPQHHWPLSAQASRSTPTPNPPPRD